MSNVHIFTNDPSKLKLDLLDICPKVGHVRSTSAFVGNEMPDQDLTLKSHKGHERSTITFVAMVMLDQDLTFKML
jgi:hypothetical protein